MVSTLSTSVEKYIVVESLYHLYWVKKDLQRQGRQELQTKKKKKKKDLITDQKHAWGWGGGADCLECLEPGPYVQLFCHCTELQGHLENIVIFALEVPWGKKIKKTALT